MTWRGPRALSTRRYVDRYRGSSLIRNTSPVEPYSMHMPRILWWSQGGLASYERGTPVRSPEPNTRGHPGKYSRCWFRRRAVTLIVLGVVGNKDRNPQRVAYRGTGLSILLSARYPGSPVAGRACLGSLYQLFGEHVKIFTCRVHQNTSSQ